MMITNGCADQTQGAEAPHGLCLCTFRERIAMCGGAGWSVPLLFAWNLLENDQFVPLNSSPFRMVRS